MEQPGDPHDRLPSEPPVHIGTSAPGTSTGRDARRPEVSVHMHTSDPNDSASTSSTRRHVRPRNNSSCAIQQLDPSTARQKRRKLLKQHRSVCAGAALARSASLQCGQFDEDFVEALKVSYPERSYYGPPARQCTSCRALFWHAERVGKDTRGSAGTVSYNKCCKAAKVHIPKFHARPEPLASLARFNGGPTSNRFMKSIRQYNCLFAFTSMGANIDRTMNDGRGPPVFKICGQIHHRIGSLLPPDGAQPKFIQLYVYDTANEVRNRLQALTTEDRRQSNLDTATVECLAAMLDEHNPLAKQFRMAKEKIASDVDEEFFIRIVGPRDGESAQYSLPTADQLALLVVGDFTVDAFERDIIIQKQAGELRQISTLHPAFMALQYPLLFPYAERGFQTGVLYADIPEIPGSTENTHTKITMQDYYCYMFHYRKDEPNPYLCYGSLSAQAKVDARACVDENRLRYIVEKQDDIRIESIQGICDAVSRGSTEGSEMGKITVLPASYTGGRRYMIQNYHDSIAICRQFGPPDFFVTFTCNPKWLEICEAISEEGQKTNDRNDLIVRVFNMKLEELLHDIKGGKPFGPCCAVLHTVEFQKRGLPHAHIILWVSADTTNPTSAMIDKHISAEIPDPKLDPLGYALVAEHMVHGPCGKRNPRCPCMKNDKCSKHYPKLYQRETTVDSKGFAVYKRTQNALFVDKGGFKFDNRWVVSYNMSVLKRYQAHVNVEWCNKTTFIKYLFKYVTKGADCSKAYLQRVRRGENAPYDAGTDTCNEVQEYLNCRYICEQDACWRMFGYDIHRHYPAVERMPIHLPNDNFVTFSSRAKMDKIADAAFLRRTMLTQWFFCNQRFPEARLLTYSDFPSKWLWDQKSRTWNKRKTKQGKIGRLHYVHPSAGERYYLRMLLLTVKGATSYEHLRFHNRIYHPTFKQACKSRGLLGDDQEWYNAFDEAAAWATSAQLRSLFVTMVLFCEVGDEYTLFERVWRHLADDIQYQYRDMIGDPNYELPDSRTRDYLLDQLSILFAQSGKDIEKLNLPSKTHDAYPLFFNRLVEEELSYPADPSFNMANPTATLNEGQKHAFIAIVERVQKKEPGFFFVSGYGGTGKTYLWNCILSYLRGQQRVVLAVASSGVAALLLPGGRTAHSRFKIPCDPEDDTVCDVSRGTMLSELIEVTELVIWDEALMTDKKAFEALDRTFRDIEKVHNPQAAHLPFGGKIFVLGGDLRQILPVVEGGGKLEIMNATIVSSRLWKHVEILALTQNMRLTCSSANPQEQLELAVFSRWVLDIGEGKVPCIAKDGETESSWIKIPNDLLLLDCEDSLAALVQSVYPALSTSYQDASYLAQRSILSPTNELTDTVNNYVLSLIPGDDKEYLSCDTIAKSTAQHEAFDLLYPVEFLNSLGGNNFPQHRIILKEGVPIMLLRNLNQTAGLCNGTRLIITSLGEWTIEARIVNGSHANQTFAIPRIKLSLTSKKWPFTLERRQYPIRLCYGMTINKSQGQTLSAVGIYLKKTVFTHGQLYVAISRVNNKQGLKIYIDDGEDFVMEDPKFFYKLKEGKQSKSVVARIIRKWPFYGTQGQDAPPLYIGMVLADAKGEAMYAQIDSDLIEKKAELFQVGKVYNIKRFLVDKAKRTYRAVDKDLMIQVTGYTAAQVEADPPRTIPHYVYNITALSAVRPREIVFKFIDVIGYLIKYEALHIFVPKNTERVKMLREIYIKDLRDNVMKITLWGDQAKNFNINEIYDEKAGNLIVCLVVGCTARKDFKDSAKIALTGNPCCSYYFNPTIPETAPFHSRFKNTPVYIERPPPSEEEISTPPQDIQLPPKSIAELDSIDPYDDDVQGPFKCAITISSVVTNKRWWYMSCRPCKKSAEQQLDSSYRCQKCQGTKTVPRYALTFMGRDETGEARFFAYDDEAHQMIQKDCESIMVSLQGRDGLPQAMQNIINKTFVFSVDLAKDCCKGDKYRQYEIKAVLERPTRRAPNQAQFTGSQADVANIDNPGSSTDAMINPHHEHDLLQTVLPTQNTPAPGTESDDDTRKDSGSRPPRKEPTSRRNLLGQLDAADNDVQSNETPAETATHHEDTTLDASSLEPATKRLKSSAEKTPGQDAAPQD